MELNISNSRRTDSTLITDEEGLKKISNILYDHNKLNVDFGNDNQLEVLPNSIKKIFSLNEIDNPEENILFAFRTRNSNNSQNNNDNKIFEEDSFIENLKNNNNHHEILNNNNFETEDYLIKTNEKLNNNNNNFNEEENVFDDKILNSMKNKSFFENHINIFKNIWEYSYFGLILFSLINVIFSFQYGINVGFLNLFMILNNIGNILLFISGVLGVYKIKIKKIDKINESNLNILLISSILTNLLTFIYIFYDNLFTQSYFIYIQILSIINQSLTLILNFKMNQFYIEYNCLLPLKYPLLSNDI